MSKFHIIIANSDGEITSHLNQSLVGMLNVTLAGWTLPEENTSDEDILFSIKEYWDNQPVTCTNANDHTCQIFLSNNDTLTPYDLNRLLDTKKALLKWAKTQIRKKVSEANKE